MKPVDNMKLMAVIQGMRKINPSSQSQIPPKSNAPVQTKPVNIPTPNQPTSITHKKNAKSQHAVQKLVAAHSRQGNDSVG